MDLNPEQVELLKAKYLDHAEDLRFRTNFDFKLLSGFVTLNLVLAAWLTKNPLATFWFQIGFSIFIGGICGIAILLFQRNYRRRKVVVDIMHNLNEALRFDQDGAFRDEGPINPNFNVKTRPTGCLGTYVLFFCSFLRRYSLSLAHHPRW